MGARLGRYVVLKHLVSGGMADVLLGRTEGIEGFERHVVLKRIRPEHARDQRFIRMFLDEARVAATLHHQHIVQVHDVGETNGEYFIAMEYIHGEDLRTILSMASKTRAHVPLGLAVAIVSAAAAGLHYAHERRGSDKRPLGIVHRDVSPSNILVGYDGSIKVVDFGIAKAAMKQETHSGTLKGKVSYMSPEQCRSEELDRRSDVYSLGVVLYELATTTRLFKGDNDYLVMDQIVKGRVSLPQVRRPDLPNELSTIIMRAIAPDPERRYFTADELRVALEQFASKAGLIASTSALASYMRKQFGDRPEPWLDLGGPLDDVPTPVGGSVRSSWSEVPHSDADPRASGAISRPSGSSTTSGTTSGATASVPALEASGRHMSAPHVPVVQLSSATPPTDSKMGWESQQPMAAPRGFTPAKIAMICAPLILILGFAIWRLAGTGNTLSPTAAVATRPIEGPPPPAPVVTPIAESTTATTGVAVPQEGDAAPAKDPVPAADATSAAPQPKRSPPATRKGTPKISETTAPTPATGTRPDTRSDTKPGAGSEAPALASSIAPAAPGAAPSAGTAAPSPGTMPPAASATPPAPAATPPATPPASVAPAPAAVTTTPPATTPPAVTPPASAAEVAVPQLAQALIDRVAADHSRELSKCDSGEELHGEISVKFSVDAIGKVTKAQIATAIKNKTKVAACILKAVYSWRFPKQAASGAVGTYTLSFQ